VSDPIFNTTIYVGVDLNYDNIIDRMNDEDLYMEINLTNYTLSNWQPGQTRHFRVDVINLGQSPITLSFDVENITDNDLLENKLAEVFVVHLTHPTIPSRKIEVESISHLMQIRAPFDSFNLANDVYLPLGDSITLLFTITFIPDLSGNSNDYQGLSLILGTISVTGM
jgi:hypothetical protein